MKKGQIGAGMIKGAIIALVFLTVFLSILPSLIHTSAESVQTLSTELSNATIYGDSAAGLGGQIANWTGYFWVLGPLVLIIGLVTKLFMSRGR